MGLIEREQAINAAIMAKQDELGWSRGAHIASVEKIDWRAEALSLEAQLAGAVGERAAMYEALVDQLGSYKLAEIAFQRRLEAKRADAGGAVET